MHINSADNTATLCGNLVNFSPETSEFKRVDCGIFAVTWLQCDNPPSFGKLAFQNGVEYHNFDSAD